MREIKFNWRRKRMSEIKFRGKREDNGEWVYGAFVPDVLEGSNSDLVSWGFIRRYNRGIGKMETIEVDRETVGQYTGLKDKNGVEIYEDDRVWCRAGEHSSGVWEYEKRFVVEYGWSQSMWEMFMCDEIEVIGNIHDNPELVEVE